jgi:hypothetical protein
MSQLIEPGSNQNTSTRYLRRASDHHPTAEYSNYQGIERRQSPQEQGARREDELRAIAIEIHDLLNAPLVAIRLHAERIKVLAAHSGDASVKLELENGAAKIIERSLASYESAQKIALRLLPS